MITLDLSIDVSDAAALGEPAHVAVTVCLPAADKLPARPLVCFAKPGAGFCRRYYTLDLPGPARGSQARWHVERGWVFIAVDHLGVGDSSHHDPARLDFTVVAAASAAAEAEILQRLAAGTLATDYPPVPAPVTLGIGQSMGGCLTVVQQGRYHCYRGIGVLGFSALRTQPPAPPGHPAIVTAWRTADDPAILLNNRPFSEACRAAQGRDPSPRDVVANGSAEATLWHYFYDDVPPHLPPASPPPPWTSATIPGLINRVLTPGVIAAEAAAVEVPVLVAVGERDVVPNLADEARAYLSAPSVDLLACPRMGHMHNFASTRELLWQRIHHWGEWVAATHLTALQSLLVQPATGTRDKASIDTELSDERKW